MGHNTFDVDGFGRRPASTDDTILDWSRDGQWFAVAVQGRGERYGVGRIRVDGSDFEALTELAFSHEPQAEWSPDGSKLLVTGRIGRAFVVLYVLDAATGDIEPLLNAEVAGAGAHWSPDGESVYYVASRRAMGGLLRMDLADRSVHEVNPGWQLRSLFAVSPDGAYLLAERTGFWDGHSYMGIYDLNGEVVLKLDSNFEARAPIADWFIPRSQLAVSPAGRQAALWAGLRTRMASPPQSDRVRP